MMNLSNDDIYKAYNALGFDIRGVPWAAFIQALENQSKSNSSYVHIVPDHCDRIVWRDRYIHLSDDM